MSSPRLPFPKLCRPRLPKVEAMPVETSVDGDILTPQEVAAMLKVSTAWIYDHTTRSQPIIPHVRMGGHVRFIRGELQRWLITQQTTA
jgi:excisionase family DNA binding protein